MFPISETSLDVFLAPMFMRGTAEIEDIMHSISVVPMNMVLLLKPRQLRKDLLLNKFVINIMQFIKRCMSGSIYASMSLGEPQVGSRLKYVKQFLRNYWRMIVFQKTQCSSQQLYCDRCERFLADRLVEGNCPTPGCNYDCARGDQCDKCGKLLNPTELLEPKCKVCRGTPCIRDTNHLFIELPKLKDKLEEYISSTSASGGWSHNAIQITNSWLREGLKPRCITRDLKWGVPVPHENFKDKVFYVWFDAPIGYVSITSCYTTEWEKWWKNPDNVELYQFMGKDNVPFHTVMFPSTLLGTGESWTMMKTISVTEYLNYESGKFSKSKGVGVFGNDVKDTNIPVEVWRYYLLANRPEASDTKFEWITLKDKLNGELVNNLGNFINRVLKFIAKDPGYNSIIPKAKCIDSHPPTKDFGCEVGKLVQEYVDAMEKVKLKEALNKAMDISSKGNRYLEENKYYKLYKTDEPTCAMILKTSAGVVYLLACLLEPFMPSFSLKVLMQLNLPGVSLSDDLVERAKRPWEIVLAEHKIGTPSLLFKKMEDADVKFYQNKFAGSQSDRKDSKLKAEVTAAAAKKGCKSSKKEKLKFFAKTNTQCINLEEMQGL
ncbi:hypothetical protein ABFX02_07G083100 [Erythranthe guttata]